MFGFGKKKKPEDEAAETPPTEANQEPAAEAPAPAASPEPEAPEPAPAEPLVAAETTADTPVVREPVPAPGGEPLPGLMQQRPMNLAFILEHAAQCFPKQEVVTALIEGGMHRQTYADTLRRSKKLANALRRLGVKPGDRVGTLAWNTHRHLEAWYAIAGQGAVCHTVNPRLFPPQIAYIINHAQDKVLLVDITFAPLIEALKDKLPTVEHVIYMTDAQHMPAGAAEAGALCYEDLIAEESETFAWVALPETSASSLCYTSGTTGDPKGVLYSHRANLLMAYAIISGDCLNMGAGDSALMVVPMFHANSWGLAYGAPMVGAKLVLPGMALDGASTHRLIKEEQVTASAAVPTVWSMLLQHLEATGGDLKPLTEVAIGGSAVPRSMIDIFDAKYGVDVIHAWGMTETTPLGTVNRLLPRHASLSREERLDIRAKQGRPVFGIELRIENDAGEALPWDGKTSGRLLVRGPWVIERYYGHEESALDANGWFDTGDIATIDPDGIMQITDRAKDVIKSGGEWISSVDLENAAVAHPDVTMAAAIGVKHPKWEERPILLAVAREGTEPTPESVLEVIGKTFAKWQLPDAVVFVDELPMTATGKLNKKVLREKFADHLMGEDVA